MLLLRYYLWIAPEALCGLALVIAIRKKLHLRFPAFATLLAFNSAVELLVSVSFAWFFPVTAYRWWVVVDSTATFVLQVFVLYEIAALVLSSRPALQRIFQPLPRWTAAILVLIATTLAALLPQTARVQALIVFHTLGFATNLVIIGLLLGMVLYTRVLGISWRGLAAGITLGLGVMAATDVAALPLMAQLGTNAYIPIDIVRMISFHVCVVIWLIYILLPDRGPRTQWDVPLSALEDQLRQLERIVHR